jgi:hypothetical protein
MTKKELKKAQVHIRAGYYHGSYCIFEVDVDGKTIARINTDELAEQLGRKIRAGQFEFGDKGRKYQYISVN